MKEKGKIVRASGGFTLVEMMVVIAIIGFLAAVIAINIRKPVADAQRGAAKMQIKNLEGAIGFYYAQNYKNPGSLEELKPEYIKSIPKDPWDRDYHYDPATGIVTCYGADGAPGGTGENEDIVGEGI